MTAADIAKLEALLEEHYKQVRMHIMAEIEDRLDVLVREIDGVRDFRKSMRWLIQGTD